MKKLAFLILVFSTTAIAAPSNPPIFILGQTVAKLPSAAAGKNQFWTVTDGATASDCSTGMGTYGVMCWSNGTTWTAVGGGGGGSGTVSAGTAGQLAHYGANGTTVSGVNGAAGGTSFNAVNYGAVSDGSTDNATAITSIFTASNAVTGGIPTVYFPCQVGSQCQYNYSGSGVSPINPTIATSIVCDPGVTLHYTGSAHMMDIGPSGLTESDPYTQPFRVTGCRFTDSGSATEGIYVNQDVTTVQIDHNYWYDSPKAATSTAWGIYAVGNNWVLNVSDNDMIDDNNTGINWLYNGPGSNQDTPGRRPRK